MFIYWKFSCIYQSLFSFLVVCLFLVFNDILHWIEKNQSVMNVQRERERKKTEQETHLSNKNINHCHWFSLLNKLLIRHEKKEWKSIIESKSIKDQLHIISGDSRWINQIELGVSYFIECTMRFSLIDFYLKNLLRYKTNDLLGFCFQDKKNH